MVDDLIDNSFPLDNDKALDLIKAFFKTELSNFKLIEFFNKGSYYGFGIKYKLKNIKINLGSPRGGLEYEIFIDGKQYSLFSYDERLKGVYTCSEKNLRFTLSVLKQFLHSSVKEGISKQTDS